MSEKITIIIGTNRKDSASSKIGADYAKLLHAQHAEAEILNLEHLSETFMFSELYGNRSEEFSQVIKNQISEVQKFVFIIPEYNGGFPGALKTFIDAVPPAEWSGKKAALVGLAAGRAGAARAMDQFTNVLNYLKVNVFYSKPKLSGVGGLMTDGQLSDEATIDLLKEHASQVVNF